MKKITLTGMAVLMLGVSTLTTGCFGEFAIVRKVYTWNKDVSSSKFVQTIVFWAFSIIPVYNIAGFLDVVIFNLIEFWSGSNPMAMKDGQIEKNIVKGKDGKSYEITATKNRFDIKEVNGTKVQSMLFNPEEGSCSVIVNGKLSKLVSVDKNTNIVTAYRPDGSQFSFANTANIAMVKDMFANQAVYAIAK